MLKTAIFSALAAIDAGLACLQPQCIALPRDDIGLAGQLWDPEGMDDICADERKADRPSHRDMDLVGGGEISRWRAGEIADFPPPLVAGHLDRKGRLVGWR